MADFELIIQPSHKVPRVRRFDMKLVVARAFESMGERLDANETAFHARALTQVMARPFLMKYPAIKWRNLFDINTEINTGAKAHSYMQYEDLGQAEIVDDLGGEFPNADVDGVETLQNIKSIGSSYSFSVQDLRAAQFANQPLDSMKGVVARKIIERKVDSLCAIGEARHGFTGLTNYPGLPLVAKGAQTAGTTWATATPSEILADINALYNQVFGSSNGTHTPNTLLLGPVGFGRISTLRLDSFNMLTVLAYLKNSLPWLKNIDFWQPLATAGAGGKERIMLGEFGADNAQPIISQDFEQFAPQMVNLTFKNLCHLRFGGMSVRYQNAFAAMDGTEP
jgi:hypothetical protein